MAINEKYSYKSFKRQDLRNIPAKEFNNSEIIGTCFHQDEPNTDVFPIDVVGLVCLWSWYGREEE